MNMRIDFAKDKRFTFDFDGKVIVNKPVNFEKMPPA